MRRLRALGLAVGIMTAAASPGSSSGRGPDGHDSSRPSKAAATATARPASHRGQSGEPKARGVLGTAASAGKFRTLIAAIVAADLFDALRGDGPFTVFAPTDEAFAKLPAGTLESLLKPENRPALVAILSYHVVPGRVLAKDLKANPTPKTLQGGRLAIAESGRGIAVDEATVLQADVTARNGVIHVIDRVLTPPKPGVLGVAEKAGSFSTLLAAIQAAKLEDVLSGDGPITVFAPTDEAFAKLPPERLQALLKPANRHQLRELLKYHVAEGKITARQAAAAGSAKTLQGGKVEVGIEGGRLVINDARVVGSDIPAGNGIIHAIDAVLIPKE